MSKRSRDEHLFGPGPKRILSLDGGGARGIVTLAFLERIESILRARSGTDSEVRLCDHFDLIGGTSTGAIIGAGLALGFSVESLIRIYLELAHRAFRGWRWHRGIFTPKFPSKHLLREIKRQVGDETLGSEKLRTGLAIIAKRIDTGSPWVFHNNPRARYFRPQPGASTGVANQDFFLYEMLRASTAAPTYYEPELVTVASGVDGLFVDGGVSPYNNPALLLFMMATTQAYGYGWEAGADKLSLISIGTGLGQPRRTAQAWAGLFSGRLAVEAMLSIITDCTWQAQAILQWLGDSPRPWRIDSEAGDLSREPPFADPLLRYQRYDLLLDVEWLSRELGEALSQREVDKLTELDRPELADRLYGLAQRAAERQVDPAHIAQLMGYASDETPTV